MPADGFVWIRVRAGIVRRVILDDEIEVLGVLVGGVEGFVKPAHVALPDTRREFGDEASDEVRIPAELDHPAPPAGMELGEIEEDGSSPCDLRICMRVEGSESILVLRRDVRLVKHPFEFLEDFDTLTGLARQEGAVLADLVPMSLAAEALVGAEPLADMAEATH